MHFQSQKDLIKNISSTDIPDIWTIFNIQYDNWTGEIIPKHKIETYSNDDNYVINLKVEKVSFKQIKDLLEQYRVVQENNAFVKEENLNELTSICNVLSGFFPLVLKKMVSAPSPSSLPVSLQMF